MQTAGSTAAWVVPFALLVVAIIAVPLRILDEQGLPRYRTLRDELTDVRAGNEQLRRRLRRLEEETRALREDPRAVELIARDELGMVREDEIVFQFEN